MASTTALFSVVCDSVDDAQPIITLLTEYAPIGKMEHAMYRPAVWSVDAAITNPIIAVVSPAVMCQVRSWKRPELQPTRMPAAPAKMKGGQVRRRVTVVLKLRVLTTLDRRVSLVRGRIYKEGRG